MNTGENLYNIQWKKLDIKKRNGTLFSTAKKRVWINKPTENEDKNGHYIVNFSSDLMSQAGFKEGTMVNAYATDDGIFKIQQAAFNSPADLKIKRDSNSASGRINSKSLASTIFELTNDLEFYGWAKLGVVYFKPLEKDELLD